MTNSKSSNLGEPRQRCCGESVTAAGRKHHFDYDTADWLRLYADYSDLASGADDQRVETVFRNDAHGWLERRTVAKTNGAGGWTDLQTTTWDYFLNGQVKALTTRLGSSAGTILESHTASCDDANGKYVGHRTRDEGPSGSTGPCYSAACVATYACDARGRLVSHDNGYGGSHSYTLDPQGNITKETVNRTYGSTPGTTTRDYTYTGSGNRLAQWATTEPGSITPKVEKFFFDPYDQLDCITTGSWTDTSCPIAPTVGGPKDPVFRVDYAYDGFDRLSAFRIYTVENSTVYQTDDAKYVYDALSRLTREQESHIPPVRAACRTARHPSAHPPSRMLG